MLNAFFSVNFTYIISFSLLLFSFLSYVEENKIVKEFISYLVAHMHNSQHFSSHDPFPYLFFLIV